MRLAALGLAAMLAAGCATLPPGADFPKTTSVALAHPQQTLLGRQFDGAAPAHGGKSAFRLLSVGVDGFLARAQMINAAQRTLDLEYFIFRQDETGQLLTDALLHAADRGVRIRVLVDDADTLKGDGQIAALSADPNIDIRIFNPFVYRGHTELFRAVEFAFNASRLDYRMHNKLLVVDNAIALVGGRNIGDQYFQVDPESQFGDDDVFAAGPIVKKLSRTFDDFWNSTLAIPVAGLGDGKHSDAALEAFRKTLDEHRRQLKADGTDYASRVASGEPLAGMLSGRLPLVWANAQVVFDSPDKKRVEKGEIVGELMHRTVADAVAGVRSELLMVTPFLIPGKDGMRLFEDLRKRGVRVRILTNSLESTPELAAQSGYMRYRVPLLEDGVELYEIRALLGNARGSGESSAATLSGNYALHAKLFVFDRQRLYIGSMNFDQRSHHLNTEVGLIIDSPELARQTAARFESIVVPANSYALGLRKDPAGGAPKLIWRTREDGKDVDYDSEPARSAWQRMQVELLSLLPLDREL
ncbi:MAG: phospholipase D family protein [Betaproteobacteria bacterium]|nr:phospholipase D family protein [Betaproteobacteria bacterium]MDE2210634.1 phospholipase D family protein [Betaproteobacteria bacterium]MDE2358673.1 phospholipase D family protein [Betaproteobacteria bacterium]